MTKWGQMALEPGYEDDEFVGWIAIYNGRQAHIYKQEVSYFEEA